MLSHRIWNLPTSHRFSRKQTWLRLITNPVCMQDLPFRNGCASSFSRNLLALVSGNMAILKLLDLSAALSTITQYFDGCIIYNWFHSNAIYSVFNGQLQTFSGLVQSATRFGLFYVTNLIQVPSISSTWMMGKQTTRPSEVDLLWEFVCINDVSSWMRCNQLLLYPTMTEALVCALSATASNNIGAYRKHVFAVSISYPGTSRSTLIPMLGCEATSRQLSGLVSPSCDRSGSFDALCRETPWWLCSGHYSLAWSTAVTWCWPSTASHVVCSELCRSTGLLGNAIRFYALLC